VCVWITTQRSGVERDSLLLLLLLLCICLGLISSVLTLIHVDVRFPLLLQPENTHTPGLLWAHTHTHTHIHRERERQSERERERERDRERQRERERERDRARERERERERTFRRKPPGVNSISLIGGLFLAARCHGDELDVYQEVKPEDSFCPLHMDMSLHSRFSKTCVCVSVIG